MDAWSTTRARPSWRAAAGRPPGGVRARAGGDETPEALEGLSWAAWWLDDARRRVRRARARLPSLQARGDAPARRGWRRGSRATSSTSTAPCAVADGWLGARHRLLDPLEPGPEHGWLAFHEGYVAHAGGDSETARELGRRAAALGRRFGVADLEMLGLALEGATLVAARAGRRRACAASTRPPRRRSRARPRSRSRALGRAASSSRACTAVLDFERAAEWCDRIAEFAERYGSRYMLAFCRAEYGAVHLWRGRWREAEAMLEASVEDFARSRPAWVGGPLVGARRAAPAPGPAERGACALLDRGGRVAVGAALPRPPRARPRRAAAGGRAARAAAAPGARAPAARPRAGARAARPRARRARRARRGGARRSRRCARSSGSVGTAPLRACADLRRGRARGRARRARARAAAARGRRRRLRAQRRAVRGGPGADRARHEPARARPRRRGRARGGRGAASARRARRGHEAERARRLLAARRRATQRRCSRAHARASARCCACSPRGSRTARSPSGWWSASTRCTATSTNLLRKLDLPSRTAAAAHAVRAGLLDAPAQPTWLPPRGEDGRSGEARPRLDVRSEHEAVAGSGRGRGARQIGELATRSQPDAEPA